MKNSIAAPALALVWADDDPYSTSVPVGLAANRQRGVKPANVDCQLAICSDETIGAIPAATPGAVATASASEVVPLDATLVKLRQTQEVLEAPPLSESTFDGVDERGHQFRQTNTPEPRDHFRPCEWSLVFLDETRVRSNGYEWPLWDGRCKSCGDDCSHRTFDPLGWGLGDVDAKRLAVGWYRDRERLSCVCCGGTDALEDDHIVPRHLRGSDAPANMQVLCRACNNSKSNAWVCHKHGEKYLGPRDKRVVNTSKLCPTGGQYGARHVVSAEGEVTHTVSRPCDTSVQSPSALCLRFEALSAVEQERAIDDALPFIDADASFAVWTSVGAALRHWDKSAKRRKGLDKWDEWSRGSKKYEEGKCHRMWHNHAFWNKSENFVTVDNLFEQAIDAGYNPDW